MIGTFHKCGIRKELEHLQKEWLTENKPLYLILYYLMYILIVERIVLNNRNR